MSDVGKKLAILDVDKFVKFGGSTFRADKFYKTIGYGLGSVGHLLSLRAGRDSDVSSGFKAISSHIGMARFVLRFTGGFEAYEALKNGSWCYGDDDAHLRRVVSLQAVSMLVYYPMEHLSYVGFVAPKVLNIDANRISRQSCMAWTIYVILDIYANFLRIRNLYRKEREIREQKDLTDEAREVLITGFQKRRKELYYQQLRNACFFPTCFHWSLENGLIPESSVQFLCFIEAVIGFWRTWVNLG